MAPVKIGQPLLASLRDCLLKTCGAQRFITLIRRAARGKGSGLFSGTGAFGAKIESSTRALICSLTAEVAKSTVDGSPATAAAAG